MPKAVNILKAFDQFTDQWSPKRVSSFNDCDVRLAKLEGAFVWHAHAETDELFYVVEGEMRLELRDGVVLLRAGDLFVVPRGVEHRPVAPAECKVLVMAPRGEANTGTAGGKRTTAVEELDLS